MVVTSNTIAFRYESPWKTPDEALRKGSLGECKAALRQLSSRQGGNESASAVLKAVERHYNSRDPAFRGFMAEAMPYFAEKLSEEGLARFWIRVTDARETGDSFFHERASREALLKPVLRHPSEAREERLRYLLEYRQVGNSSGRTLDVDAEVVRTVGATQGDDIDRILLDIYRDAQANGRMSQSAFVALGKCLEGRGANPLP